MRKLLTTIAGATLAALSSGTAMASEDYDLRYAPGIGSADMAAPFEGGWVFQLPAYNYGGHVTNTSANYTPMSLFGVFVPGAYAVTDVTTKSYLQVVGLLPRLSYLSQEKVLGAQVGVTALLPLVSKKSSVFVQNVNTVVPVPGLTDDHVAAIQGILNAAYGAAAVPLAAANSNARAGVGDLEISPLFRWSSDASQVMFIPTVVFPTGDFKSSRAANPGAGKFYTFRAALQYSYIGEGWDMGTRVAYSVNTRDTESHYKTGNYVNLDAAAMKWLDDSWHAGVTGYFAAQTTRDSIDIDLDPTSPQGARYGATLGKKGHVVGIGPELAYIKGAGEYLAEIRIMKEFKASDRPQGFTMIANFSKPF